MKTARLYPQVKSSTGQENELTSYTENRRFEEFEESIIEDSFGTVMSQIKYLARGTKFATVEARFESVEKAKEL